MKEKSEDSLQEDTSCAVSDQETEGRERVPWLYKILLKNDHNIIVVKASHKKHKLWLWWIEAFYITIPREDLFYKLFKIFD